MRQVGFSILAMLAIMTVVDSAAGQQPVALVHQPEEIPPGSFSESSVSAGIASGSSSCCCERCGGGGGAGRHFGCRCREVCCPRIEEATEKRSCWVVKCEKVCVPAVQFPWEPGGSKLTLFSWFHKHTKSAQCGDACHGQVCRQGSHDPDYRPTKCGYVRCVCVLDSEDYEVTAANCQWDIRRLPACSCATSSAP
jgi:hypothetical protein